MSTDGQWLRFLPLNPIWSILWWGDFSLLVLEVSNTKNNHGKSLLHVFSYKSCLFIDQCFVSLSCIFIAPLVGWLISKSTSEIFKFKFHWATFNTLLKMDKKLSIIINLPLYPFNTLSTKSANVSSYKSFCFELKYEFNCK